MAKDYGDTSIKTLDPVTHIRMRPGLHVGELGTGAMYRDGIGTVMWPGGEDLCPDDLYDDSVKI